MNKRPPKLATLSPKERSRLTMQLLQEQVVDQRQRLHSWRDITEQPAQIDTGYVAQHLVSLVTAIPGAGMRGKGLDLIDGSEIKSANFLDALDKRGAKAPRWNFLARNEADMEAFLGRETLYLVSLDQTTGGRVRARVWRLFPGQHEALAARYREWMKKKGKPKLSDPRRPDANFQLFPPRNQTDDDYARHGNGHDFERLQITLEVEPASRKIYQAEEDAQGQIQVLRFAP
ncbi:MAG: MamI family restriction endonuclease [Candidatus Eisenbacteria bacterium]|nr:MamI family restriction endonuclease [Candidatus Eisenbacteria bacterium]